jgi:hypothetical protein
LWNKSIFTDRPLLLTSELRAIDDFRFNKRMPSRASALRELLKRGLAAEGFTFATVGMKSAAYGVLDEAPAKGLTVVPTRAPTGR